MGTQTDTVVVSGRVTPEERDWLLDRYGRNRSRALRRMIAAIQQVEGETQNQDILLRLEAVTRLVARSEGEDGRFQQDDAFDIVLELNRIAIEVMGRTEILGPAHINRRPTPIR